VGYYYLAAQLPYLVYGQKAPMSSSAFKELCGTTLSHADAALLNCCTLDPEPALPPPVPSYAEAPVPSSSNFIDRWRAWERTLRLNLARYRAQRFKREGAVDAPEYPADAAAAAKAAAAMESPLEAEFFLDKARWNAIENYQGLDYFSRNTVYAYLLKLLLMERWSLFKAEEGLAEYQGLYAAIMAARPGEGNVNVLNR
jgi:hypothetical protein